MLDLEMLRFNINSKKNILDNQYPYYLRHYNPSHTDETRIVKLCKKEYLILLIRNHMKLVSLFID